MLVLGTVVLAITVPRYLGCLLQALARREALEPRHGDVAPHFKAGLKGEIEDKSGGAAGVRHEEAIRIGVRVGRIASKVLELVE